MTEQQAAALAEKHGFAKTVSGGYYCGQLDELAAMLTDHDQQVIDRLVREAGVMPELTRQSFTVPDGVHTFNIDYYSEGQISKAIAAMQAKLDQAESRMAELEKNAAKLLELLAEASVAIRIGHNSFSVQQKISAAIDAAMSETK